MARRVKRGYGKCGGAAPDFGGAFPTRIMRCPLRLGVWQAGPFREGVLSELTVRRTSSQVYTLCSLLYVVDIT
jgi:hypothetical protein